MKLTLSVLMLFLCLALVVPQQLGAQDSTSADDVVNKAIQQEQALEKKMAGLRPLVETYTQKMDIHPDLGAVPKTDKYFLGKLDLSNGIHQKSLLQEPGRLS